MKIEKIENRHIDEIVEIYIKELNMTLLSMLGRNFIKKMFEISLKDNLGFVSLSDENLKVNGFVFMTKKDVSLFRCINLHTLFCFIKNILFDFKNLKAFIISFFKLYLQRNSLKNNFNRVVELSHIAVTELNKSKGIGSQLIKNFEKHAILEGYNTVFSSTHNQKFAEYYVKKKNARLLSIIDIGIYKSHTIIWNLK
jgi:hypothetical protein